mgnify:CR=1 FL=1
MAITISEIVEQELQTRRQVELAELLGVSQAAISRVRHGKRSGAARVALALLAAFPERRTDILEALGLAERPTP